MGGAKKQQKSNLNGSKSSKGVTNMSNTTMNKQRDEEVALAARIDERKAGKEDVLKLRDVFLTQENKLDGEDPLAEKAVAIRNRLRTEIAEDFDKRIDELKKLKKDEVI
ncbi:MAG: hypothetical protein LC803_09485 [Acidobacteria bacterium]|nr:hypothetical protein [Acidobacteriota bacterium]